MTDQESQSKIVSEAPSRDWTNGAHRQHILLLVCACFFVWGWTYGLWDLWGVDEARYTLIAKKLLGRDNWFLLTLYGEPYDQKPPLPFWIYSLMLGLNEGRVNVWFLRFPPVAFATAGVLLTYEIGRKRFGARAGLLSALVLLTSLVFVRQAPKVRLDIMFAAWVLAALGLWLTRKPDEPFSLLRAVLFWLATAAAFFTKGPLALLLILGTILGESVLSGGLHKWRSIRPLPGMIALFGLIFGWFIMEIYSVGADFVWRQFAGETVGRLAKPGHANPIYYYAASLYSTSFMPWMLFFTAALIVWWRERKTLEGLNVRPFLLWIFIPLLIFHINIGKRQQYLVPLIPAMALVVGWYLDRYFIQQKTHPWVRRGLIGLCGLIGLLFTLTGLFGFIFPDLLAQKHFEPAPLQNVALLIAGFIICFFVLRNLVRSSPALQLTGLLILTLLVAEAGFFAGVYPGRNTNESRRPLAETIEAALPKDVQVVGAVGMAKKESFHIYGRYQVETLPSDPSDYSQIEALPPVIVCMEEDVPRMEGLILQRNFEYIRSATAADDVLRIYINKE